MGKERKEKRKKVEHDRPTVGFSAAGFAFLGLITGAGLLMRFLGNLDKVEPWHWLYFLIPMFLFFTAWRFR